MSFAVLDLGGIFFRGKNPLKVSFSLSSEELVYFQISKDVGWDTLYKDFQYVSQISSQKCEIYIYIFFFGGGKVKILSCEFQLPGTNFHCVSTAVTFLVFLICLVDQMILLIGIVT